MEKMIKQCVGMDVSQKNVDVMFGSYHLDQAINLKEGKRFRNVEKSFPIFLKWALKRAQPGVPLFFTMEATGVYHEKLACFLVDNGQKVNVVFPNRANSYAKTLEVKTVTDKEASKTLARMGLEKRLPLWSKPDPVFNYLKQLTREREQLQKAKTVFKNHIHAETSGAWIVKDAVKRAKKMIDILTTQIKEIEGAIIAVIKENPVLKKKIPYLTSIKGIGVITAATVVGETNGFSATNNKRQLTSYAGYDVIVKDSGTSVHSKAKISKRGNRHIRKAMYFPSLTAARHDPKSKGQYQRMVGKHGIKMKASVAIQRKLLVLMFILWKKEEAYDPEYDNYSLAKKIGQLALP